MMKRLLNNTHDRRQQLRILVEKTNPKKLIHSYLNFAIANLKFKSASWSII